jgi:uncharacterized membrane protein YcaP (DUF421 family)
MDAVLRAVAMYAVLLLLFRVAGRRTLAEITTFDFVLLLIIGEATQQALLGEDFSFINAFVVIVTLLFIDIVLALWKARSAAVERMLDGVPTVIVEHGRCIEALMKKARVDQDDVMEAARRLQGIERLDQIKYAVIEVNGGISIIPYR